MALNDSFPGPSGITDSTELRKNLAGLIIRDVNGVPRSGIFPRHPYNLVVGRSDMKLDVYGFEGASVRGGGPLFMANDGTTQSPLLPIPLANSQISVLYFKQNEAAAPYADVNDSPIFGIVSGAASATPAKPPISGIAGAVELATITVPSTATATNSSGVVITNTFQYTAVAGGVLPVRSAAERNLYAATPGAEVFRMDVGWNERNLNAGVVATPGWYDTAVRNFYKRGTDVNPIPVAVADVPGSSLTFGLESPRFCTFTFAGGLQVNQSLTASIFLNVDGVDVQVTTWARQESGGTPYLRVAETYGALLAAGTHTVKLRVIATVAGASVAQAPGWSMVGTVPILGTYN